MDLWVTLELDTTYEKWRDEYETVRCVVETAREVFGLKPEVDLNCSSNGYPLLHFHYPNICEEWVYRILRRAAEKAEEDGIEVVPDVVALELLDGEDEGQVLEELERLCWSGAFVY